MNYKSRYSGEQVDAFLGKAAKMGAEIDYIKNNTPIIDTGVTLDNTSNLNRDIKLFKKDGSEATDARDVYSGFLRFKYLFDPVPFTQDIMILQNIMEEGYIEYKEVHQIVFKGNRIHRRTVHVDCGDFDANGERAYPITQENYDDGNYNTGFYTVLWSDDLLDGGMLDNAIDQAMQKLTPINPDYNQNDPTKAGYIKNRPFYTETIGVEAELTNDLKDEWSDVLEIPVDVDAVSKLRDFLEERTPITVEILYNDNVYRKEGFITIDGNLLEQDGTDGLAVDYGAGDICFNYMADDYIHALRSTENIDGISIKIYREHIEKIDKKYLPPNDVPYIYSEETLRGCVRLADLASGVYVLHGCFDMTRGDMLIIPYFEEKPILCHVQNDNDNIKLFWFDASENGFIGRYMNIYEGEIVSNEFFEWEGIMGMLDNAYTLADEALTMASEAQTWAEDANCFAADAIAAAEEAYYMAEHAIQQLGEVNTAVDEIIELQNELLVPNGDEVDY